MYLARDFLWPKSINVSSNEENDISEEVVGEDAALLDCSMKKLKSLILKEALNSMEPVIDINILNAELNTLIYKWSEYVGAWDTSANKYGGITK